MATSESVLQGFRKVWNQFLTAVKEVYPDRDVAGMEATEENAPQILVNTVLPAFLEEEMQKVSGKVFSQTALKELDADLDRILLDGTRPVWFGDLSITDLYRETESPETRLALQKYVHALYHITTTAPMSILAAAKQKGGSGSGAPGGLDGLADSAKLIESLLNKDDMEKLVKDLKLDGDAKDFNPIELLSKLGDKDSEISKMVSNMGEKLSNNTELVKKIEDMAPKILKGMLSNVQGGAEIGKAIEGIMSGGAPDLSAMTGLLGKMMGGGAGAGAGASNPLGALAGLFGGKKEDETLPGLDDIETRVRQQFRKEYREAAQREALRKKLAERRKQQPPK